jgi:putative FmdB family regulatory protein
MAKPIHHCHSKPQFVGAWQSEAMSLRLLRRCAPRKHNEKGRGVIFTRRSLVKGRRCVRISSQQTMPIYEYWCDSCRRVVSSYRRNSSAAQPPCPRCGSSELKRIFSTFSVQKTYRDVYEDILSDRGLSQGMMHDDPRAIAEWNKRMSGGEKPSPEYEEITQRMEGGEWPVTQIEEKRKKFSGQVESKPGID